MKFTIILLLCFMQNTFAQQENPAALNARSVMEEIEGKIRKRSLYRDSINWDVFHDDINHIDPQQYHPDSLMIPYILTLYRHLRAAGDHHSFYIGPKASRTLQAANDTLTYPEVSLIDGHTGYIKVPQLLTFNRHVISGYADTLRARIRDLDTHNEIRGWIIDLRNNSGGTMWPMIAGLNPVTADGIAGYFIDAENREDSWKTLSRNPESVGRLQVNYKCRSLNNRIAVLINEKTGSSGEMVAISFSGLPNVKTFGGPSAGYTTANSTIALSNGGFLLLATSFSADRNKKIYKGRIMPDVLTDEAGALEKARRWLSE